MFKVNGRASSTLNVSLEKRLMIIPNEVNSKKASDVFITVLSNRSCTVTAAQTPPYAKMNALTSVIKELTNAIAMKMYRYSRLSNDFLGCVQSERKKSEELFDVCIKHIDVMMIKNTKYPID